MYTGYTHPCLCYTAEAVMSLACVFMWHLRSVNALCSVFACRYAAEECTQEVTAAVSKPNVWLCRGEA